MDCGEFLDEFCVFADEFITLGDKNGCFMKNRPFGATFWIVIIFTVLHAVTCIACRTLETEDTQVLTLLTLAMVFILCNQSGFKIYFTLVALVLVNVLAYLIGNALPTLLVPLIGDSMWVNVIATAITTLVLGSALHLTMKHLSKSTMFKDIINKTEAEGSAPTVYRQRWIVRLGDRIVPVQTDQIACFFSEDKSNYLLTFDGNRYIVDATMDAIIKELDPERFFRINRSCILALRAIESAVVNSGRYSVEVHPLPGSASTVVTRSRESEFLHWLEKG